MTLPANNFTKRIDEDSCCRGCLRVCPCCQVQPSVNDLYHTVLSSASPLVGDHFIFCKVLLTFNLFFFFETLKFIRMAIMRRQLQTHDCTRLVCSRIRQSWSQAHSNNDSWNVCKMTNTKKICQCSLSNTSLWAVLQALPVTSRATTLFIYFFVYRWTSRLQQERSTLQRPFWLARGISLNFFSIG